MHMIFGIYPGRRYNINEMMCLLFRRYVCAACLRRSVRANFIFLRLPREPKEEKRKTKKLKNTINYSIFG